LYKAVCEGQTFNECEFKWYQIDDTGSEKQYFSHKLEGVKVCSVKPIMYNVKDPAKERYVHLEEVSMRYRKITWTYLDGNLQAADAWAEGRTKDA
jgi:type VI secretion system secreted protein Hcp